ncbi:hypothetical protein N431DRAFT_428293, partial [Stipitochalara longipes BDJ]
MTPAPFFALAVAVAAVNGKLFDQEEFEILDRCIKGATTLFPIFFAAITGRAAIKYATWKLEQGTTIGVLEQLMGSRTVASAFSTQLLLRSFNITGFLMILVWSLSPIGAQSILHILNTPVQPTSIGSSVAYFNSRQQSYAEPQDSFLSELWFNSLQIEMSSAMIAPGPIKASPMDLEGNVKIPYQSSILAAGVSPDSEGWVQISSMNASANGSLIWSSLFGIPINGIASGNTTFNIESTYMELNCTSEISESLEAPDGPRGPRINQTIVTVNGPYFSASNPTYLEPWIIGYRGVDVTAYNDTDGAAYVTPQSCPDCLSPDFANKTIPAGTIAFQEFDGSDPGNATTVFCNPYQRYVESQIFCMKTDSAQECQVTAQRYSVLPHMPAEVTYFSFPSVALGASALLKNITPMYEATNELQNYILYDPMDELNVIDNDETTLLGGVDPPAFLYEVPLSDVATRLGQILNAFVFGSTFNASTFLIGGSFEDMNGNLVGGNNASFVPASRAELAAMIQNQTAAFTVPAVLTTHAQVYLCSFPWLGVFLFSTLIMLISAIIGVVYSRRTIVPDYLGFVSSLAKESPWIRMPDVGVNMDGMDKARLVKDVKVRLGDVSYVQGGYSKIGRLAFARLEETTKVEKEKLYV